MSEVLISVVTIAKNEENNIATCLKSTQDWADEHIVVDDFSTDKTVEIAKNLGAKVFQKKMDIEGIHRNWAYSQARNEWILSLDADEEVSEELKEEIETLFKEGPKFNGYSIPIRTYIGNHWVQYGGWYPAGKVRLFKKSKHRYEEVEVHPVSFLEGKCGHLKKDIIHKGYPDFSNFLISLNNQTTLEAKKWFNEKRRINFFKMLWKAMDRFFRTFIRKKGYKDGIVGFAVGLFAGLYQIMSYAKYWELRRRYGGYTGSW